MRFSRKQKLIVVRVAITGPAGRFFARLAVDTGATLTSVRTGLLETAGYDLSMVTVRSQVTMGSAVETVPRLLVERLRALGTDQENMVILAHDLPPTAGVDGVLGLDFFRDKELTIDFRSGLITLR